jgi:hypothetical protein
LRKPAVDCCRFPQPALFVADSCDFGRLCLGALFYGQNFRCRLPPRPKRNDSCPASLDPCGQFLWSRAPVARHFFYGQNFSCRLPPRPICSTKLLHFDSVASNLPAGGRAHGCYRHPSAPVALNLATGLSVRLCSGSETSILTTIIGMTLGVPPLAKISAAGLPPRPKRIDSCPAPFGTYGTRPAIYNFVRLQCDLPSGP